MASYDAPNPYVPNTFNSSNFILPGTTITTKYLNENYLQFPFAQGTENFVSINNQGSLTQGGRAEFSSTTNPVIFTEPPTITNPVIYPATIPGDSLATITYVNQCVGGGGGGGGDVYTNLSNIYDTGLTQTFQGNSTAPTIVITNTINNSTSLLSTTTNNSLEITSAQGVALNNTNGNIVSFAAIDGNIFKVNNPIKTGFYLDTPSIVFLSSGTTYGTLTGDNGGITSDVNMYVPTQTAYNSGTTYMNVVSTQAFVQSAINSQGGGDVSQGGNNDFTGINNFNNNNNGGTITKPGLTISGNTQVGYAEGDIICINNYPISNIGLNIYCEPTMVTSSTVPRIQVYNDGNATLFNTNIQLPAQTAYDSGTTYGNIGATQAFVQSAIPFQYSYITGSCSPNYDIVLGTNPYIVASYQSTIQNFTNAASSATYNFICSRVNNVGTLTFNFIPSIPTSGNQQTINNMICITRTVPNNTFWPAGKPPSGFFNLTDMIVLAYFQVPVAYFNANAYNYVNQLFLQYDTGSGIEGQMVGVCIIPIIVVDVYYYIMAIIPNGAIHYTLPSIYSIYIPQISISIPLF